jgi:transcriptional regulator with XRE-family HTH domain
MIGTVLGPRIRPEGFGVAKKKRETFGARLVRLREAAGVSQYALAKMTGLTRQSLSYLETEGGDPGWDTVQRLAKALGLSCEAFEDEGLTLPEYKRGKPGPKPRGKKK